jgi:hypothetical protein
MNALAAVTVSLTLFLTFFCLILLGRRLGRARLAADPEGAHAGLGPVEGAVFGLMGLLIAFTFSGAAGRFDERRHLIFDESNAIGTAYLRLDLLQPEAAAALREKFRRYLDSRIRSYSVMPDVAAARAETERSVALQGEIWKDAVAAGAAVAPPTAGLLLASINEMIDITTTRKGMTLMHPPPAIFAMLGLVCMMCALLVGYGMAQGKARHALHLLVFAAALSTVIYVILDLEYPRLGLIRIDATDAMLGELRRSMD